MLIQADQKTELPPQTELIDSGKPTRRSTAGTVCIADTVEVQRRRGLPAGGGTLGSPYWRSKPVRTRRRCVGRSRQPHSLVRRERRERLLRQRIGLGVDTGGWWWGQSLTISLAPSISGPITDGGRFLALQLSRLTMQIVAGFH